MLAHRQLRCNAHPFLRSAIARLSNAALGELQAVLGERVTASLGVRRQHADMGLTYHASIPPEAVALPHSTKKVAETASVSAR